MSGELEQDRVAHAVWRWREAGEKKPDATAARQHRATVQFFVMLVVGGVLSLFPKTRPMGITVAVLALFVWGSGFWLPRVFDGIDRFFRAFGRIVGISMTWLLLVPFFYLVFVPARIVLWMTGKDPMKRRIRTGEATYWVPRPAARSMESYRKQY